MLEFSVIIPTHNRSHIIPRILESLARQDLSVEKFEVILVADGCEDDTRDVVSSLKMPYQLKFFEQPALGLPAARNRGAAESKGKILLFLDDDMEAMPRLLTAHLKNHLQRPGGVVLGYFPVGPQEREEDLFIITSKLWWSDLLNDRAKINHRFTFRDLCGGNFSIERNLFESAGGFDVSFHGKSREDYELGYRLIKQRISFYFEQEAVSIHHDKPTLKRAFGRARADGRGDVLIAIKYPELIGQLELCKKPENRLMKIVWPFLWVYPVLVDYFFYLMILPLKITRNLKLRKQFLRYFSYIHRYSYWVGVRQELKTLSGWKQLTSQLPLNPPLYNEIELDLLTDFTRVVKLLNEQPVDSVNIRFGDIVIGQIPPLPGAEPLRAVHVYDALIGRFNNILLTAVVLNS